MKRLLAVALLLATPARATEVGFGAAAGVRSLELGLMLGNTAFQEARGPDANLNAYVSPAKLPLAVGIGLDHQSYELNKSNQFFDHMEVTEADLGVAFMPQGGKARPVVRLGYTLYGNAVATTSGSSSGTLGGVPVTQNGESVWKMGVTGTHLSVGTEIEAGKGSLLHLGLDFGQTAAALNSVSLGGSDQTGTLKADGIKRFRMKSTAILVGGEVAL